MTIQRPKDLVFTLFGEYLLDRDADVPVRSLIALLEPFGLSEGAVRTALSRMARKGWLATRRRGRHAHYALTERGRRLLEEGQARIYRPRRDRSWDGRWTVLAYSIPQRSRHLRDRLRDRLAWLGFGSLGNGLWISPHDVVSEVRAVAEQLDIAEHVECFRATRAWDDPVERLVDRCWDLPSVHARYAAFLTAWRPALASARRAGAALSPRDAYVQRFRLIHEFRAFPLLDPYLPEPLLPDGWPAGEADALFRELHDVLVAVADAWVDTVLG